MTAGWRRPLLAVTGIVLVVELAMVGLGMGPQTPLVLALGGCLGASVLTIKSLGESAQPAPLRLSSASRLAEEPRREDQRVRSLRSSMVFSERRETYSDRVCLPLIEIIDDQLVHAHGIVRAEDPQGAASVLGPELDEFVRLAVSEEWPLETADIERIVGLIEQL